MADVTARYLPLLGRAPSVAARARHSLSRLRRRPQHLLFTAALPPNTTTVFVACNVHSAALQQVFGCSDGSTRGEWCLHAARCGRWLQAVMRAKQRRRTPAQDIPLDPPYFFALKSPISNAKSQYCFTRRRSNLSSDRFRFLDRPLHTPLYQRSR